MKKTSMIIALACAALTLNTLAQDAGGPPPPEGTPGQRRGGVHLLPPHAAEQLNLTADQQKQLAELEAEVKAKIEKILTPEQLEQLKKMRPPQHQGGSGGKSSESQPNVPH